MQEGTVFNLTGAPLAGMQARGVEVGGMSELQRGIGNAAEAVGAAADAFVKMQEYKARADEKLAMQREQQLTEAEMQKRLQAAPGTALSFMNEDGSLNREKVNDFAFQYKERMGALRGSKWDLTQAAERDKEWDAAMQNNVLRMMGQVELHELENIKRAGQAILEECMQNNDGAGYVNEVARQVKAGILSEREGRLKNLAFGKGALRRAASGGGRVRIGGGEYSGLAAALRAQQIKDGYEGLPEVAGEEKPAAPTDSSPVEDWTLNGMPEEVSLKGTDGTETEVATPGVKKDYTLDAARIREANAPRMGDEWLSTGDYAGVLKSMNQGEIDGLTSLCVNDGAIVQKAQADGSVEFTAGSVTAPEAVERVAAVANVQGEVNSESARAMVARMAMDAVTADGDATAEQICKMFDESGIYEALGDGDAEVGKVRSMQVVHEMVKRGKQGSLVLNNKSVEAAVDSVVNEAGFGEGSEWKEMEKIGQIDGKWEKPKDEEGREKWFKAFAVYKKYRDRFNQQHPEGEADKEEFAEKAEEFSKWYAKTVGKELKRAEQDAARDWYAAKVYEGLLGNVSVGENGKAGYGSYASDVAVMREVLSQTPPRNLGAEDRLKMLERKERDEEARSEKFRRRAAEDYERLRGMKQEYKDSSEKAQKAKDKAENDERKEQERMETRKRNVARALPRQAEWVWDGEDDVDGALPACTVPEEEYKRLVEELGYDGTQVVYVQVAGAKLQVTGANKHGRMLLNTAAVAKVQKKPNAKKGERLRYQGNLGYSYYFKNMSANN